MKKYCPVCKTTHDEDLACFDATAQAAREMGMPVKEKGVSPDQAARNDSDLRALMMWVALGAIALVAAGAFMLAR